MLSTFSFLKVQCMYEMSSKSTFRRTYSIAHAELKHERRVRFASVYNEINFQKTYLHRCTLSGALIMSHSKCSRHFTCTVVAYALSLCTCCVCNYSSRYLMVHDYVQVQYILLSTFYIHTLYLGSATGPWAFSSAASRY